MVTKDSIERYAQNKPTLIVKDIIDQHPEIDPDFIYGVLLQRGVFKWLAVRQDLIRYKDELKAEIVGLQGLKTDQQRGYLRALENVREELRYMCHSKRWRCPDNDRYAKQFLREVE